MNSRDVRVIYPHHEEGKPFRVRLEHKPLGLTAEADGADYTEATAKAMETLERDVLAVEASGTKTTVGRA